MKRSTKSDSHNLLVSQRWDYNHLGVLLIFLMVCLVYLPSTGNGFIWDDDAYVTDNLTLRSLEGLGRIWFEIRAVPQYYPMVHSSYWIEYHLWGLNPLGYHLTNVLLHALNAILLFLILRRLSIPGAWVAAIIFALHPVQVESVAWITERKNVLSGCFYLSSLLVYIRFLRLDSSSSGAVPSSGKDTEGSPQGDQWRLYGLALGLYVCALLSKTVTCSMPAAVVLLLWWKRGRIDGRNLLLLIPFFLLGAALGLVTVWMEREYVGAEGIEWAFSFVERCLIAGRVLWFYTGKLLWPLDLIFIYPRWEIGGEIWWQYLFPLAAVGVVAVLWLLRRKVGRGPLTAVLFFAGTLFPALGFFNVYPMRYSFVADHFQYLASIGIIVLVVGVVETILSGVDEAYRKTVVGTYGVIILALGILVWQQGKSYKDAQTLWYDTLARNPECWMAYHNLGTILTEQGKIDRGIEHYKRSLEIRPNSAKAHNNLGNAYTRKGRLDKAVTEFKRALAIKPDYAEAYSNFGNLYLKKGDLNGAIDNYKHALAIKPDFAEALTNLGTAYAQKGRLDEAISEHKQALDIEPYNAQAHNNLGSAYAQKGWLDRAIAEFEQALDTRRDYAEAHANLGNTYFKKGQLNKAISELKKALALRPDYVLAHTNLGTIYLKSDRLKEAIAEFRKTLATEPDHLEARSNLGIAFVETGRLDEAVLEFKKILAINPHQADAHHKLGSVLKAQGRLGEAISTYQEVLRLKPDHHKAYNNLAWIYATCPDARLRDGEKAVALATRACELSGFKDMETLDTLAAACAEKGLFDKAVEYQLQAIKIAPPHVKEELKLRLQIYRTGHAYREDNAKVR